MINVRNQRHTYDPLAFYATVAFGLLVLSTCLYLKFREQFISGVLAYRHLELTIIGYFTDAYVKLDAQVVTIERSSIGLRDLWRLGTIVGESYAIPGACLLTALAGMVFFHAPRHRYSTRIKHMDDLILALDDRFRYARAYVGRKLRLHDP